MGIAVLNKVMVTYAMIEKNTDKTKTQLQYRASNNILILTTITAVPAIMAPMGRRNKSFIDKLAISLGLVLKLYILYFLTLYQ